MAAIKISLADGTKIEITDSYASIDDMLKEIKNHFGEKLLKAVSFFIENQATK